MRRILRSLYQDGSRSEILDLETVSISSSGNTNSRHRLSRLHHDITAPQSPELPMSRWCDLSTSQHHGTVTSRARRHRDVATSAHIFAVRNVRVYINMYHCEGGDDIIPRVINSYCQTVQLLHSSLPGPPPRFLPPLYVLGPTKSLWECPTARS